jgi:hypothetical protein
MGATAPWNLDKNDRIIYTISNVLFNERPKWCVIAFPASGKSTNQRFIKRERGHQPTDTDDYIEWQYTPVGRRREHMASNSIAASDPVTKPFIIYTNFQSSTFLITARRLCFTLIKVLIPMDEWLEHFKNRPDLVKEIAGIVTPKETWIKWKELDFDNIQQYDYVTDNFNSLVTILSRVPARLSFNLSKEYEHVLNATPNYSAFTAYINWVMLHFSKLIGVDDSTVEYIGVNLVNPEVSIVVNCAAFNYINDEPCYKSGKVKIHAIGKWLRKYDGVHNSMHYISIAQALAYIEYNLEKRREHLPDESWPFPRSNRYAKVFYIRFKCRGLLEFDATTALSFHFLYGRVPINVIRNHLSWDGSDHKVFRTLALLNYPNAVEMNIGNRIEGYVMVNNVKVWLGISGHMQALILLSYFIPIDWYGFINSIEINYQAFERRGLSRDLRTLNSRDLIADLNDSSQFFRLWHNHHEWILGIDAGILTAHYLGWVKTNPIPVKFLKLELHRLSKMYPKSLTSLSFRVLEALKESKAPK